MLGIYVGKQGKWVRNWLYKLFINYEVTELWLTHRHLCFLFHQNLRNILPHTKQKKNYVFDEQVKLILLWKLVNNLTFSSALCIELCTLWLKSLKLEIYKSMIGLNCIHGCSALGLAEGIWSLCFWLSQLQISPFIKVNSVSTFLFKVIVAGEEHLQERSRK